MVADCFLFFCFVVCVYVMVLGETVLKMLNVFRFLVIDLLLHKKLKDMFVSVGSQNCLMNMLFYICFV